ncbi:protachykinin-1 isoform X7 [Phascolarctos cinereus]
MKILVALAVLFLASAQAFAEEMGANDDLNYWADWSDSDQIKGMAKYLIKGPRNGAQHRTMREGANEASPMGLPSTSLALMAHNDEASVKILTSQNDYLFNNTCGFEL